MAEEAQANEKIRRTSISASQKAAARSNIRCHSRAFCAVTTMFGAPRYAPPGCHGEPHVMNELKHTVSLHYSFLFDVFKKYSAMGTGSSDAFTVGLSSFILFAKTCNIFDESSKLVSRRGVEIMLASIKRGADSSAAGAERSAKRLVPCMSHTLQCDTHSALTLSEHCYAMNLWKACCALP